MTSEIRNGRVVLGKATAVTTRGSGVAREVLVFDHPGTGPQLPSGTVEAGEPYAAAARRELREETGLESVRALGELGRLEEELGRRHPCLGRRISCSISRLLEGDAEEWDWRCDCGVAVRLHWAPLATVELDPRQRPWLELARSALR